MHGKFVVGAARCESYDDAPSALPLAIARAGGLPRQKVSDVLIKANFLSPRQPEDAVTTHPEILRAIVRAARGEYGDVPIAIGDNPGYVFITAIKKLFEITGASEVGASEDATVDTLGSFVAAESALHTLHEARVSKNYLEAGITINAAKMKTHVETEISGCIKNLFGIADTATRKAAHRSTSQANLAHAIVDLFSIRKPDFNVLDAVVAMEGYGPSHGSPRRVGWILAGENALAIDLCVAAMMGYRDPKRVPLIEAAIERGLGPRGLGDIEIVGATLDELTTLAGGKFKKSPSTVRLLPTFLRGLGHSFVSLAPELDRSRCVKCSICARVCPVDAITMQEYPRVDANKCVRCLCCHEMCPTGAMAVRRNFIAKLFGA